MSEKSPSLGSALAAMNLRDDNDSITASEKKQQFPKIPYEVALLICESLVDIAYAKACEQPMTWQITAPKADASSAPLYVVTDKHRQRPEPDMKRRFQIFKDIRQVNRKTRIMVDKAFPRAIMYHQRDWGDTNDHDVKEEMWPPIWICPDADIWKFRLTHPRLAADQFNRALGAFWSPDLTPESKEIVKHIQTLKVRNLNFLINRFEAQWELAALPNLKKIHMITSCFWPPTMASADPQYLWPIDQGAVSFPHFPHFSSAQLNHVFGKLWEKGVKITMVDRFPTVPSVVLEMIETRYGVHLHEERLE
ncbi:hypothetical protein K4K48_007195 [Colletotrichum sp. SAR 10_66]|nr:hypothetical protein K4K48_007195 [Colletotrichum sp. SAR 10_66]